MTKNRMFKDRLYVPLSDSKSSEWHGKSLCSLKILYSSIEQKSQSFITITLENKKNWTLLPQVK